MVGTDEQDVQGAGAVNALDPFQLDVACGRGSADPGQREIFGPVVALTSFDDEADALKMANDTPYGLGAGVWSRDAGTSFRMGRGIQAGRVWTNCYHAYPAHAAFGGYKASGIGREMGVAGFEEYLETKAIAQGI